MSTKAALPRNPEKMERQLRRIGQHFKSNSAMMRIPPIAALECQMVLHGYYGGSWRMIWALIGKQLVLDYHALKTRAVMALSDGMGWTKLHHYPESADFVAHAQRHGRQCSGSPNCADNECIDRALPRWLKWITRWDKY